MFSFLGDAFFTFSLQAYPYANHTGVVPNPIKLDVDLYFKVIVVTQSAAPNLDLFIEKCFSSANADPYAPDPTNFDLIVDGYVFAGNENSETSFSLLIILIARGTCKI